jgi:tRNA (cytidine56-2'-O)-methyltransferase
MISVLVIGGNDYAGNLDLCLTARALGASEIIFAAKRNARLVRYISTLERKWGGRFRVNFTNNYTEALRKSMNYKKVYLTRYGMPLNKLTYVLNTYKNIMLIVSPASSSPKLHGIADFNVSVTDQPHCSSAAIAIFLHDFYRGRELAIHFENAKYKVMPKEHGVSVERIKSR